MNKIKKSFALMLIVAVMTGVTAQAGIAAEVSGGSDQNTVYETETTDIVDLQDETDGTEAIIGEPETGNDETISGQEEPSSEDPTGEDPSSEDPSGEDPTGEDPTGEDPTVEPEPEIIPVESITLDNTELSIVKGKTAIINATVLPEDATDKTVTFKSSRESVVKIETSVSGKARLSAVNTGTAVITVSTTDGSVKAECTVKVIIPPTGIKLQKAPAEMGTKESVRLTAQITPANATEKDIIWTSSDEKIATVDKNGLVRTLRYGKVTITAALAYDTSKKASCQIQTRFYDVNGSSDKKKSNYQYYYTPVYWAAQKGITKGYDNVYFGPGRSCTRREMMIFIWRLAGKPGANGSLPFRDVKYGRTTDTYKAILWGYKKGIIKGYGNGQFKPEDPVARKDSLIMLYRLKGKPKVSGTISYPDVVRAGYSSGSDTYKAILWAYYMGITNGYSDGNFKPFANCLREHIVTFIYRYTHNPAKLLYLSTPTLKSVSHVSSGYKVTWSKVSNATSYDVYFSLASHDGWQKVGTTKSTSFTYKNHLSGRSGYFTVKAKSGKVTSSYNKNGISTDPLNKVVINALNNCGWNIEAAFRFASDISFIDLQPESSDTIDYAAWVFANKRGDCIGKSAVFTLMARELGYEAYLVKGWTPFANGGGTVHGWADIYWNDDWYVCDLSFDNGGVQHAYMVQYGKPGTLRYQDYHRMP